MTTDILSDACCIEITHWSLLIGVVLVACLFAVIVGYHLNKYDEAKCE